MLLLYGIPFPVVNKGYEHFVMCLGYCIRMSLYADFLISNYFHCTKKHIYFNFI